MVGGWNCRSLLNGGLATEPVVHNATSQASFHEGSGARGQVQDCLDAVLGQNGRKHTNWLALLPEQWHVVAIPILLVLWRISNAAARKHLDLVFLADQRHLRAGPLLNS